MRRSPTSIRPGWLKLLLAVIRLTRTVAQETIVTTVTSVASSSPSLTIFQSSASTSSSAPQTHTIQVGLLDHKMRPETTEADVGDIIEFHFYPLNHSIVRAEYGFPCIPYEMTGSGKQGFFSGFHHVGRVLDNPPKYSIRVNDTDPIFFYCSAPGSCITWGMVGGINLNSSMSIDRQRTLAMDSTYMLQPDEPFPPESPLPSTNPASSDSPSPSSNSDLAPSTQKTSPGGLSTGAIVGIVIAAVSALLFGALLFFCWGRTKSLREAIERKDGTVQRVDTSSAQVAQHAPNVSHAGFAFPAHAAGIIGGHPGSPNMTKYASPTTTHPAYHAVSSGSPPHGNVGLNGHSYIHPGAYEPSPRGTPGPGYYKSPSPGQDRVQERAVEMEAITTVSQVDDTSDVNRTSKY